MTETALPAGDAQLSPKAGEIAARCQLRGSVIDGKGRGCPGAQVGATRAGFFCSQFLCSVCSARAQHVLPPQDSSQGWRMRLEHTGQQKDGPRPKQNQMGTRERAPGPENPRTESSHGWVARSTVPGDA